MTVICKLPNAGFIKAKPAISIRAEVGSDQIGYIKFIYRLPKDKRRKGYVIKIKPGEYPKDETDGETVYDTADKELTQDEVTFTYYKNGFIDGTKYYISIFTYTYKNAEKVYTKENNAKCTAIPCQISGELIYTESDIFVVPYGVTSIDVFLVGGGAGGYEGDGKNYTSYYGGGGGGYTATYSGISVSQGEEYVIIVGAGGNPNCNGGTSMFGEFSVSGGTSLSSGGCGGSGGGAPDGRYETIYNGHVSGQKGGSDGSNGYEGYSYQASYDGNISYSSRLSTSTVCRVGQGTTTRAFNSGTLYAGGGGGATSNSSTYLSGKGGAGGTGGGGKGSDYHGWSANFTGAASGDDNSGGGGGGGCCKYTDTRAGSGGSGIVIVRWGNNK